MMKKRLITALLLIIPFGYALPQNVEIESAIRNSQNIYQGSARFMGMGGAFTALGGDISSISLNPAGVGVYTGMQFVFTPSFHQQTMESTTSLPYNTFSEDALNYKININNAGLIGSYNLKGSAKWKNLNVGLGYNTLHHFNREVQGKNFNRNRSKLNEFVDNANNDRWRNAYEELAWQTYLMRYDSTFSEYWSFVSDEFNYKDTTNNTDVIDGVNQHQSVVNSGNLGEYFIAAGANYNNKLYVGLSIGIQRVKFSYKSTYTESEQNNQVDDYQSMNFQQYENHSGTGYNFKIGAIYKPVDFLRIGAAFHSPTFFNNLEYGRYNQMTASFDNGDNPSLQSDERRFAFQLTTPSKLIGGVAAKIGDIGMISADYERLDYSNARVDEKEGNAYPRHIQDNDSIQNILGEAHNLRLGGELRFNTFYVRGGYAFYGSPFSDAYEDYQSARVMYSGGVGYREKGFFVDLTYVTSSYTTEENLFTTVAGLSEIDLRNNRIILTAGFRF